MQTHNIRSIGLVGEVNGVDPTIKVWAVKFRRYNLSDDIIHINAKDAVEAYTKALKKLETEI